MLAFATVLAVLPLLASATLQITQPSGAGWVGNTTVTVAWSWDATDPTFSIELGNPDIQEGLLAQGPIAVANNVAPNTNSISFELPVIPPGDNYYIHLVNIADINNVYAKSPSFSISNNPKSTAVSSTGTVSNGSTSRTASIPLTGTSTPRTSSGTGSSSGSSTPNTSAAPTTPTTPSQAPTTLQISTLSTSSAAPTSSNAASSLISGTWSSTSFVVALGGVLAGAFLAL